MLADNVYIELRCPKCKERLIKYSYLKSIITQVNCNYCDNKLIFSDDHVDALITQDCPCEFSRQWTLWENGLLGPAHLIYGKSSIEHFNSVLKAVKVNEHDLQDMRILEVGSGHGRLLQIFQKYCPMAYGIDLVKPLATSLLHPGSVFCGDLFHIPIIPKQFDLVICRGVIQHTGNAQMAFTNIAEQVSPNGTIYLTVYEKFAKKSLFLRNIFLGSWLYPEPLRLAIATLIGLLRASFRTIVSLKFDSERFVLDYGNYKLSTYDVISPRYTSTHKKSEICSWFEENGFTVKRIAKTLYVGKKSR